MAEDLFDSEKRAADGTDAPGAIVLRVHVQPGAGRPAVVGTRADALSVRVAPPPADGRANSAVIDLLSELFGVAKSELEIVGGEHSREKRLRVRGVGPDVARRVLTRAVDEAESGGRRAGGRAERR